MKQKRAVTKVSVAQTGLVTELANRQLKAWVDEQSLTLPLPGNLLLRKDAVAVGDEIEVELAGKQSRLLRVLPRKTGLYRGNRRAAGEKILIAANAQQVLVVATADYLVNQCGFVESAQIAANRAHLPLLLAVSKLDVVSEQVQAALHEKLAVYDCPVFFGTLRSPDPKLAQALLGKTTVLVGDRGAGKTTLMQNLLAQWQGGTAVAHASATSAPIRVEGPDDTAFIDTPGFRDFFLQDCTAAECDAVFPEIAQAATGCAYSDCSHTVEDGCAVAQAVSAGTVSRNRLAAYQKLLGRVAQPKADYRFQPCTESFPCKNCGELVTPEDAGTRHRNHCPKCLCSVHVDIEPGDRASTCHGIMEPISVWVRKDGEWALIHRCKTCGALSSNRIAADDNPMLLLSIAVRPLAKPAFPLDSLELK